MTRVSSTTSHAPVLSRAERRRRRQVSFLFDPDSVVRVPAGRPRSTADQLARALDMSDRR